jgi:hypothetical protein
MVTLNEPCFQPDQYFQLGTLAGFTSPAMIKVVYSGRYQRSKKFWSIQTGWACSMSRINPWWCVYTWREADARAGFQQFSLGGAVLLYSPRTARFGFKSSFR